MAWEPNEGHVSRKGLIRGVVTGRLGGLAIAFGKTEVTDDTEE